jgi:hypothetical protein
MVDNIRYGNEQIVRATIRLPKLGLRNSQDSNIPFSRYASYVEFLGQKLACEK